MQKKQTSTKQAYTKLSERVAKSLAIANKLCESTPTPQYSAAPDPAILKNLLPECEDSDFWMNFRKAAPIMFCVAIEGDKNLQMQRDMSFIEELLKTKSILTLMNSKLEEAAPDVDVIDYSLATKMIEYKLAILNSLNVSVEEDGEEQVSFNLFGSNKSIIINKAKLREAITIQEKQVVEKQAQEEKKIEFETIPTEGISEEEFIGRAVTAIGELKKTAKKTLDKDSFIKVFRYTGDFAKMKGREIKKVAQEKRCEFFNKNHPEYLKTLKANIQEEEKAYEASSQIMFDKLNITPENFERSQQELMQDPYVQMEIFNLGISMEQPNTKCPEELTAEKTIELVKASNDFAFDLFKKEYLSQMDPMNQDMMMMPVLISAIAHDWVKINHGFAEEDFKAALFHYKIYENPEVAQHMQSKQMELMQLAAQQNPMAMAAAMGGGMGPPPQGGPQGGMGPGMQF